MSRLLTVARLALKDAGEGAASTAPSSAFGTFSPS